MHSPSAQTRIIYAPMTKQTQIKADGWLADPPKMRPKLRQAVGMIAREGLTVRETALRAGWNESALYRAVNRADIKAFIETEKALYCLEADKLKGYARAAAYHEGITLMRTAVSEAVRARLVELFTSEAKSGSAVNVQVNVDRGGYEFRRPGQRLVDIAPSLDTQSGDDQSQETDNE